MAALLEIRDLRKNFGALAAVAGVSLDLEEGKLHAIIGPNGAGKTTLFNCITGELAPSSGSVVLDGKVISGRAPHELPAFGVARSFQRTSIFPTLTVAQNVWVAACARVKHGRWNPFRRADAMPGIASVIAAVLQEIGLEPQADKPAKELAHGDQRLLDLAIALASQPRLLLLDEPTAGLSRSDTQMVISLIGRLKQRYTILLIEHKMNVVLTVSDRVSVMYFGQLLAEGTPSEIRNNPRVREAYLGRQV
jgi:branched-chain amino acid transport system ATP-binding protein